MEFIFNALRSDKSFDQAVRAFSAPTRQTLIYGLTGTQKSALLAAGFKNARRPMIIVTGSHETAEQLRTDLATFLVEPVVDFPATDLVTFTAAAKSVELASKKMDVLSRLVRGETAVILATAESAVQKVHSKQEFLNNRLAIHNGDTVNLDGLVADLVRFGYERVDQVDNIGQFSSRGGILDIFPVNRELPVRLEFFGDEVDSLREFSIVTQRSAENIAAIEILPVTEPERSGRMATFLSYLRQEATVVFDEPGRIRESINKLMKENPELRQQIFGWHELASAAKNYNTVHLSLMAQKIPYTEPDDIVSITAKTIAPFHRQMELVTDELGNWLAAGVKVLIFMSNRDKAVMLQRNLVGEGIHAIFADKPVDFIPATVTVMTGTLFHGFELPHARIALLTEMDIFGRQKKKRRPRTSKDQQITYFRDIKIGDYVVHINHGIGKYTGVETLEVAGVHKDYFLIRYAGEDKLYVPTDQVHLLQKYIGAEGETPRLSKMGGSDWLKAKSRAKAAATDLARELLALYAERQLASGFAFAPDTPWQREFEDAFVFEETPDQLTAIAEVKADMETPRPMDRLLCGDVGFGKTEVAIRAAFKAVMSGKQVAVLVPTTVLAQQHYQTFSSRFAGFGPVVDVISRFRSPKEQKTTINRLSAGQIDVLIGTHRILQPDVVFKDLGLLIVDEEQRFGVAQKERLKKWRSSVDVLTLTATPIPRTLHMSLVGVRDMSIIETPPEDRFPVQTYVVEYQEEIIRDAIRREIRRSGQVYFVYNKVQTIDKMHSRLTEMLPDARIGVAHGQMPEELLEQVMLDYYEGHYDVLVCTSIIENGLDVPNANTIIVYDADYFGLSQLYQMRGRVGRSHRLAYAYFTYRRDKVLSEVAEKRLQAIKEFAELGAGFKIAMRDLEIRGAGNILGAQQHGHIVNVGFEMYCRLLDEAVQEMKNGSSVEMPPEPVLEFNVDAYLSGDYISNAMHKIEIYQRIAAVRTEADIKDLLDELIDRFGEPPAPVLNLLTVARIKNLARLLGIKSVIQRKDTLEVLFTAQPNVSVEAVLALRSRYPGKVTIFPGPPEIMQIKTSRINEPFLDWLASLLKRLTIAVHEKVPG